jgi:hypothetical protein
MSYGQPYHSHTLVQFDRPTSLQSRTFQSYHQQDEKNLLHISHTLRETEAQLARAYQLLVASSYLSPYDCHELIKETQEEQTLLPETINI